MTTVRVIKDWSYPDINRQTIGGTGIWDGVAFVQNDAPADYVVVLNGPLEPISVQCPREHLWLILQEPPNELTGWMHRGRKEYARIFTTDPDQRGARIVHAHPALPWHVDKTYEFLKQAPPPEKPKRLSWITSAKAMALGHRRRLAFGDRVREAVPFDLFGHGFTPVADKWTGLAPYRYSLAIENHSNPYYWTEKLADCFLAWTMPIYYGCTEITRYFPEEALLLVDIDDPEAPAMVRDAIETDRWKTHRDAIEEARNRILDEYQFFPFVTRAIRDHAQHSPGASSSRARTLAPLKEPVPRMTALKSRLRGYAAYAALRRAYRRLKWRDAS